MTTRRRVTDRAACGVLALAGLVVAGAGAGLVALTATHVVLVNGSPLETASPVAVVAVGVALAGAGWIGARPRGPVRGWERGAAFGVVGVAFGGAFALLVGGPLAFVLLGPLAVGGLAVMIVGLVLAIVLLVGSARRGALRVAVKGLVPGMTACVVLLLGSALLVPAASTTPDTAVVAHGECIVVLQEDDGVVLHRYAAVFVAPRSGHVATFVTEVRLDDFDSGSMSEIAQRVIDRHPIACP